MANTLQELLTWSYEDALKVQREWSADPENKNSYARMPMERWQAAQNLKELEKSYVDTGNPAVILKALFLCTLNDIPIPYWLKMAFLTAYRNVKLYRAGSWDDVFGRPHPKGTHLSAKKQRREKQFAVYNRISEIKRTEPDAAIDGALFERVGRELGIGGKTTTEEYYYNGKRTFERLKSMEF